LELEASVLSTQPCPKWLSSWIALLAYTISTKKFDHYMVYFQFIHSLVKQYSKYTANKVSWLLLMLMLICAKIKFLEHKQEHKYEHLRQLSFCSCPCSCSLLLWFTNQNDLFTRTCELDCQMRHINYNIIILLRVILAISPFFKQLFRLYHHSLNGYFGYVVKLYIIY
jgi:hypothetical protein